MLLELKRIAVTNLLPGLLLAPLLIWAIEWGFPWIAYNSMTGRVGLLL